MANALGKPDDYRQFYNRSMSYKNNYDSYTGFMRPKWLNGEWVKPFDPNNNKIDCFAEGSSWNYTFMAPHDIPGLMKLMGGPEEFIEKLNACFDKGFFDITNEPDLAYPYLYNYIKGQEWRTQDRVRDIIYKDFSNSPGGLPGNDDCGTMSAWLVFSMMGFYPACPGDMLYQIGSPLFSKVIISLDHAYFPGGTFVITARSSGKDNRYVQSMSLNGKSHPKFTIRHEDIAKGGELVINMGNIKKAYHPRHSR
jgi:predicted alpha-1,2-mannosidase